MAEPPQAVGPPSGGEETPEEKAEKIERRFELLCEIWGQVAAQMGFVESRVRMNYDVLSEVVHCYYRHIGNHKRDHDIDKADPHKSAGFTLHWICKLKPVQLIVFSEEGDKQPSEPELLANELFAVHTACSILNTKTDLVADFGFFDSLLDRLRKLELPAEFAASLFYLYEKMSNERAKRL